jgi:hypothetical protein
MTRLLLRAVFALAWRMADAFGCVGVVVEAKAEAVESYRKLGFRTLQHRQSCVG